MGPDLVLIDIKLMMFQITMGLKTLKVNCSGHLFKLFLLIWYFHIWLKLKLKQLQSNQGTNPSKFTHSDDLSEINSLGKITKQQLPCELFF